MPHMGIIMESRSDRALLIVIGALRVDIPVTEIKLLHRCEVRL